ncbi:hypothetical protein [Natrinema longum]|uniref:Uncharacterized protein n=1 Tax=Natrinema longum TaxID=370324 RepID=A0A8A2U5R4_9EURY|nr:hypothetical protein [Natrinema longum]MBZ6494909.1 hypothetical protein [Natrinema longum]QSW83792.1 hypothetical protein J0X27_09890 [Natrinema longum]
MNATILGEDEEGIGVLLTDSGGREHELGLNIEGKIIHHLVDQIPDDPSDRTREQNEAFSRARRYAKYYVAQETGYDTASWDLNPDRFEDVRQALMALSSDEIDELFGDLLAQSLSHYRNDPNVDTAGISRPFDLPADKIGTDDAVLYKQEIYLDEAGKIEAVSGVLITYYVARGERTTVRHGEAPDRDPDACVEVSPAPFVAPEPFRDYLVYNLRCQIRDCYVGMGLEPPEAYKILGPGQYRFTGKYQHFDCYPKYYDKDAAIPGYSHDFVPELPVSEAELGGLVDPTSETSLYDQIKGALFSR